MPAAERGPADAAHLRRLLDHVIEQDPAKEGAARVHDRDARTGLEDAREGMADLRQPLGEAPVHPAVERGEVDLCDVDLRHDHAEGPAVDVGGHARAP